MPKESVYVAARIGKPHGLRGEVTVQVHTDDPSGRFTPGASFDTRPPDAGPLRLRSVRVHRGTYLLGFEGCQDRNAAEALRGTRLLVTDENDDRGNDAVATAGDGVEGWREDDLIGFRVFHIDGTDIGTVSGLHTRPVQDLLEISRRADGGTSLVPFVAELVLQIDEDTRQVLIDPPAGLLEMEQ